MKKILYALLIPLLMASCNTPATPDNNQNTSTISLVQTNEGYSASDLILPSNPSNSLPTDGKMKAQVNEDGVCYTYSAWNTVRGCTVTQRDLVNFAGYIYRKLNQLLPEGRLPLVQHT